MTCHISELTISSWNIRGLGDKYTDELFVQNIKSDINVLLETWKGENAHCQLDGFITVSKSRKKHKKSRRHSGGIILYIKKNIFQGITYIPKATLSPNRLWLKLDKNFFGMEKDLYLCAIYIPPYNSVHLDDDFVNLENEIANYSNKGFIALIGDFNSRVGAEADFIYDESSDTKILQDILPPNYEEDVAVHRMSQDKVVNSQGKNLLNLCM